MQHETDLDLITNDVYDIWCWSCRNTIPRTNPYFSMWDDHNGMDIDICVSCVKKCHDTVRRYELEKKTYLM